MKCNKVSLSPFLKRFCLSLFTIFFLIAFFLFLPNLALRPLLLAWFNAQQMGVLKMRQVQLSSSQIKCTNISYQLPGQNEIIYIDAIHLPLSFHTFYLSPQAIYIEGAKAIFTQEKIEHLKQAIAQSSSPGKNGFSLPFLYLKNTQLTVKTPTDNFTCIYNGSLSMGQIVKAEGNYTLSSGHITLSGKLSAEGDMQNLRSELSFEQFAIPQLIKVPIQGKANLHFDGIHVHFQGTFYDLKQSLSFSLQGLYDTNSQSLTSTSHFKAKDIQEIIKVSQIQTPLTPYFQGQVHLRADIQYVNGELKSNGILDLQNVSYKDQNIEARDIQGKINFSNLLQLLTPPQQKLTLKTLKAGLPFENIQISFQLLPSSKIAIENIKANLQEGIIHIDSFTLSPPYTKTNMNISITNLPAQELASLASMDDLTITGKIEGKIQTKIDGSDYGFNKGSYLKIINPPGTLRYRPKSAENLPHKLTNLHGNENPGDLIYLALWNFHYTELKINIEKQMQSEVIAQIHLKGYNPDMFKGHPFDFHIKANGQLIELIEQTLTKLTSNL